MGKKEDEEKPLKESHVFDKEKKKVEEKVIIKKEKEEKVFEKEHVFDDGYVDVPEEIDKKATKEDIDEYEKKQIPLKEESFEKAKTEILEEKKINKEELEEAEKVAEEIKGIVEEIKEKPAVVKEETKKIEEVIKKVVEKRTPIIVEEKKGFFGTIKQKITTTKLNETKFDELFWDLEMAMLENNVAVEVINKIKTDLMKEIVDQPIQRGKTEEVVINSLKRSINDLFKKNELNILELTKQKKPLIICFVGINGSGKTTSIAKMAKFLQKQGLSVVMAAADTFRAAAIDQLQIHADNLGVKLIRHDYGSDAAAVAYDAVEHAKAKNKDVVLIDTAGRLHSNHNLVDEMKKIVRVAKPDLKIFVGESITGNDCVEQAQKFNEAINLNGIILSKADIDEKGGAALSVSYVTGKPILYLGTGQEYDDLEEFSKEKIIERLGL